MEKPSEPVVRLRVCCRRVRIAHLSTPSVVIGGSAGPTNIYSTKGMRICGYRRIERPTTHRRPIPRLLDIKTAPSTPLDQLPQVRFREDAIRWAGYLGNTGQLLAIRVGGQVVAIDPTTGVVTRRLFTLRGATSPVADVSGRHIAVRGADGLYRWAEGDTTAHKISDDITAAVWVPQSQADRRLPP
jgi:hypothetical protein